MEEKLTKTAVARRQLVTAIRLLFTNRDLVSIYSLATNAWEVIDVLCQKEGVESLSMQTREHIPSEVDLKRRYINAPYRNFFKHADSDFDKELDPLPISQVDAVVFLAVEDYMRLRKKSPIEFQVFQLWYLTAYPDKLIEDLIEDVLSVAHGYFPNLSSLPRLQQLAFGERALADAYTDEKLLQDPRTEPAFN